MRKLITLLPLFLLLGAFSSNAQIFWVENFESGSTSGLAVTGYTGPNGTWGQTATGASGALSNVWYVSCAEQGHITSQCGDVCGSSTGLGATLHVGAASGVGGDNGASYFAGPGGGATGKRAESPVINCSGKTNITLSFYYIEDGDGTNDDGTVYYSADGGTTWTLLGNPAKTPTTCSPQGTWDHYSVALPATANNNANVKIGFSWVNNADGIGTDPSFAIDSVSLSTPSTTTTTTASFTTSSTSVCQDSCITFTNTSTGTVDSFRFVVPGVTVAAGTTSPVTVCFPAAGTYAAHLYVHHGTSVDSSSTAITINQAPHPVITVSGHTMSVTGTYTTYQWMNNDTAIAGATNATYTYTGVGSYQVMVDSGGCKGTSNAIVHTLGVAEVSADGIGYSISQSGNDAFTLYATQVLNTTLDVRLYDATGRTLMQDNLQAGTDRKQFNVSNLSPGIYIIRLGNSNNSAVLKWLKN